MTEIDEIADALLLCGIHVGFDEKLRALAGQLFGDGVKARDIEELGAHVRETTETPGAAARVLFSILGDAKKRDDRIAHLRRAREIRSARSGEFGAHLRVQPRPIEGEDHARWREDRLRTIAYCRVVTERAPLQVVAGEMGLSKTEVANLVEAEKDRRKSEATKPVRKKLEDPEPKRREQWLQEMRAARKALPR